MILTIDAEFDFGDIVYLKTDPDQLQRIVTGFTVRKHGVIYELSLANEVTHHYDFEISVTQDIVFKITE
jgi:hypothetical protein